MITEVFKDDETGYRNWYANNAGGYVLNATRNLSPSYLMLHSATCRTIIGEPARGKHWTKDYIKVCAAERQAIDRWARAKAVGGRLRPCRWCNPD